MDDAEVERTEPKTRTQKKSISLYLESNEEPVVSWMNECILLVVTKGYGQKLQLISSQVLFD